MSFQAMTWALRQKLPTNQKFVLLMVANYASNERGDCYPSIGRLADDTSLSKDSVMRAITAVEGCGLLTVLRRRVEGVNLPNVYTLHMDVEFLGDKTGVVADSDHYPQEPQGVVAHSDYYPPTATGVVADSDSNLSFNLSLKNKRSASAKSGISFNVATFNFNGIDCDQKGRWKDAFPAINVDAEILRAALWLKANPENRKSNYEKFLTNWLMRSQDRAPRTTTGASNGQQQTRRPTAGESRDDFSAALRAYHDRACADEYNTIDMPQ